MTTPKPPKKAAAPPVRRVISASIEPIDSVDVDQLAQLLISLAQRRVLQAGTQAKESRRA